jgi:hypothetical protein
MTTVLRRLVPAALFLLIFAPAAHAQVDVSSSLYYGSPYVWRGQVLSGGFVFQPTVSAGYGGFSLTFFGNVDPKSGAVGDKLHLNEADLTAAYGATLGGASLGAGYTLYTFPLPGGGEIDLQPTHEIFGSLALDALPLSPSLLAAYDFTAFKGLYAEAAVSHGVTVGGQPFDLGVALGLDSSYLLDDETALSHVALTIGTAFGTSRLEIAPLIGFQVSVADVYRDYMGSTFFYGGIGIGF